MKHDELTELFKEHYNPLLLYMLSLSKNRVVSEDIVSEAFFKALMSPDAEIGNFRTWSFRVCRNLYFNHLRKSRRLAKPQDESVADGRKAAIDEMIDDERYRALYRAVELLDDVHREAITLFYFEEQSVKQIAEITGKTQDHVKVILFRARKIEIIVGGIKMDFENAYQKFLDGTATPEEVEFVRSEIRKAKELSEIIDMGKTDVIKKADDEKVKKAAKKFSLKMAVTTVCIVLVTLVVAAGIVLGSVFGVAVGGAKRNTSVVSQEEVKQIALDYIKTELNIDEEAIGWKIERDLEMTSKLKNSYYIYEVDVNTSRGKEIELEIDGRNGKVIYVEVDRY